jgi:hypothetical protein
METPQNNEAPVAAPMPIESVSPPESSTMGSVSNWVKLNGTFIATFVVLVLLVVGLWFYAGTMEGMESGDVDEEVLESGEGSWDSSKKSAWGQGVKKRQLLSQNQQLYGAEYDDWNQMAAAMALEPEVFDSHNEYTNELNYAVTAGAKMGVRTDPNDVNNWVGFRRPNYHEASSPDDTARQVPSSYVDQYEKNRPFLLTG